MTGEPEPPRAAADEETFISLLRRAGELVAARRLPEAEMEILKSLSVFPRDLRALKLLALVRFKLGRLAEAREVYRNALEAAPDDPAVRLNLGLIALKLEWFEDAVAEIESATRLRPDDQRAWGYLGYAYARTGAIAKAAAAFRRAGQQEVAAEIERAKSKQTSGGTYDSLEALVPGVAPVPESAAPPPGAAAPAPVTGYALSRLVPPEAKLTGTAERTIGGEGVLRFAVQDEAHVRQSAVLATAGDLELEPARRRKRGRLCEESLGDVGSFLRCRGAGAVWLTRPPAGRGLVALTLEQDILYVREDRVVAFDGDVVWESGRVPRDLLPLLQFRGTGRVVVDAAGDEVVALRVPEGESVTVPRVRLLGWLGRIVAQSVRESVSSAVARIACEGEGVLLLSKHGDAAQSVHERPEPGDDGPGAVDPGRPDLHR